VSTACSSGAGALIKAAELIRAGLCDAAVAGGLDIASETALLGFASLELVSEEVCNPFSKNRRGITLGEGAAFFVLSSRDFSGAGIELAGIGESADASHITSPRADGGGAIRAMEEALKNAGMGPGDLGYINLHGTGTPLNDRMEARALAAVFPAPEKAPLVSSTKPITGHTLGAAGALELALCWMALHGSAAPAVTEGPAGRTGAAALPAALPAARTAALPVHCWDGVYDDDLPVLRFAAPGDGAVNLRACMSNSFAFGGCNISLILRKRDDHGL
jgi:3-oxoacyl-[acyl-carrier-protein] synthase-1